MSLDHLLAADPRSASLDDARRQRASAVLLAFGAVRQGDGFVLDSTFAWLTVESQDGLLHVHVELPLPEHLIPTITAVLEGLVMEAGLVRIDPLTRREIDVATWSRRVSEATRQNLRKGFP